MTRFVKNSCPECGGSLRSWKCLCKPIWSGYTTSDTEHASTVSAITDEQIEDIDKRGPLIEGWRVQIEEGRNGLGAYAYFKDAHDSEDCYFLCAAPTAQPTGQAIQPHAEFTRRCGQDVFTASQLAKAVEPSQPAASEVPEWKAQAIENAVPYCLGCEKEGHLTTDCHSTHGFNSPRDMELARLSWGASRTPAPAAPSEALEIVCNYARATLATDSRDRAEWREDVKFILGKAEEALAAIAFSTNNPKKL